MKTRNVWLASVLVMAAIGLGTHPAIAQNEGKGKSDEPKPAPVGKAEQPALPKCPVSGETANLYVSTTTDDGPVYFCCSDCIAKFKADPKKYAEKVAAQREALKKLPRVQVTCPISGKPVSDKSFVEKDGQKVYFCGDGCKAKYEADPAAFKAKLEGCYTYQTRCPVMGGEINPTAFTDLPSKQRVYFCCMACEKKLLAEPEKYAPKLAAQGYKIDVEKVKKAAEGDKKDKP